MSACGGAWKPEVKSAGLPQERRVKKQLNWAILVIAGLACNALPAFPPQNEQERQKSAQCAA
jgi:hypothetical protein